MGNHQDLHVRTHSFPTRRTSDLAGPHDGRFAGDHWAPGPLGLPLLKDVPAWMLGRIVDRVAVADSAVVVVRIESGGLGAEDAALLYQDRKSTRLNSSH